MYLFRNRQPLSDSGRACCHADIAHQTSNAENAQETDHTVGIVAIAIESTKVHDRIS
jgi:hypothetical protein